MWTNVVAGMHIQRRVCHKSNLTHRRRFSQTEVDKEEHESRIPPKGIPFQTGMYILEASKPCHARRPRPKRGSCLPPAAQAPCPSYGASATLYKVAAECIDGDTHFDEGWTPPLRREDPEAGQESPMPMPTRFVAGVLYKDFLGRFLHGISSPFFPSISK